MINYIKTQNLDQGSESHSDLDDLAQKRNGWGWIASGCLINDDPLDERLP